MEVPTAAPSAPEQLAFLLDKRSGLATDLQAEIGALQVKVQHIYTHAMQQLEKEGNVVKAGDGDERENGEKATAAATNPSGSYAAAADTDETPLAIGRIATAGDAGGSVDGSGGGGGSESGGGKSTRAGGGGAAEDDGDEEEEEDAPPIEWLQDEILCIVFSNLDAKTLMVSVPQVCKLWRALCQDIQDVHLDFSWWGKKNRWGILEGKDVPVEVLAGWRQMPFVAGSGDGGSTDGCAEEESGWKTGLCELFPRTASVTMGGENVQDAHLLALADKCPGITRADFSECRKLMNAAVLALADKCPGITHADFRGCRNLTDAAVVALADKCPGLMHANFRGCRKLTDAAVVVLADKCPGITHADFRECENLSDAAVVALADKCPGITHADFGCCENLTDAAVVALADKCPGITFANFGW